MTCEWCGHEHAREALCTSRPKWSRRGFLALMGAAAVGAALDPSLLLKPAAPALRASHWITLDEGVASRVLFQMSFKVAGPDVTAATIGADMERLRQVERLYTVEGVERLIVKPEKT